MKPSESFANDAANWFRTTHWGGILLSVQSPNSTENMMNRLTSDVSIEVSDALPESQRSTKDAAAFEKLRKTTYQVLFW
jgi:hypothetical protein